MVCGCVGGAVVSGCCVMVAFLRVVSIGLRAARGASTAFSVFALMQTLIGVVVLACLIPVARPIP